MVLFFSIAYSFFKVSPAMGYFSIRYYGPAYKEKQLMNEKTHCLRLVKNEKEEIGAIVRDTQELGFELGYAI